MKHPSEWTSVQDMDDFLFFFPVEVKDRLFQLIGSFLLRETILVLMGEPEEISLKDRAIGCSMYRLDLAYNEAQAKKTTKHDFGTGEIFGG